MSALPYQWARVEEVDGVSLVRLSDGSLSAPGDAWVIDLETGVEPVDEAGVKRAIFEMSPDHIAFYDYADGAVGDDIPTRQLAGRFSVTAIPLETD